MAIWIVLPILTLLMFDLGLTLRPNDFMLVFKQPKAILLGLAGQLIVLPLIAFALAEIFDLSPLLSRRPGTYTQYLMSPQGEALSVRDPDGVHVSREGGKRVAETLLGLSETRPVRRSESRAEP